LQVTLLSSWNRADFIDYLQVPPKYQLTIDLDNYVVYKTEMIMQSGCDGVIASGTSVTKLRNKYPNLLIVTPGIRPSGASADDHKRSLTPAEAIRAGADYLVVGRPIRDSRDPKGTAAMIQNEIAQALASKAA